MRVYSAGWRLKEREPVASQQVGALLLGHIHGLFNLGKSRIIALLFSSAPTFRDLAYSIALAPPLPCAPGPTLLLPAGPPLSRRKKSRPRLRNNTQHLSPWIRTFHLPSEAEGQYSTAFLPSMEVTQNDSLFSIWRERRGIPLWWPPSIYDV